MRNFTNIRQLHLRQSDHEKAEIRKLRKCGKIDLAEKRLFHFLDKCSIQFTDCFAAMDVSGNGRISIVEFTTGLKALNILDDEQIDLLTTNVFKDKNDDEVDYKQLTRHFRESAVSYKINRRLREAAFKILIFVFFLAPLMCFISAAVLGGLLAALENWSYEDSFYVIVQEITQIGINMGIDELEVKDHFSKIYVSICGIYCLSFLALIIGIVAGPLLTPIQQALNMQIEDEGLEDIVGNVDISHVDDPQLYTLRNVLLNSKKISDYNSALIGYLETQFDHIEETQKNHERILTKIMNDMEEERCKKRETVAQPSPAINIFEEVLWVEKPAETAPFRKKTRPKPEHKLLLQGMSKHHSDIEASRSELAKKLHLGATTK